VSRTTRPAEKISPLDIPIQGANPSATLAKLYRQALAAYNIEISSFNQLLERFLTRRRIAGGVSRDRSSDRGNLRKELLKDNMTFKSLCKGLDLITIRKVEIVINMVDANKKKRSVRQVINFGELPVEAYDDEPQNVVHLIQPRKDKLMPQENEGLIIPMPNIAAATSRLAQAKKETEKQLPPPVLVIKPTLRPKRVGLRK
jgi:hypothetical protein